VEPRLSVIIPTHKRAAILRQCLDHIAKQTVHDQLEVIVVSDGHDDATAALFEEPTATRSSLHALRFLEIQKSHQGTARNAGVKIATAPTVLFLGDDFFLLPDACERHIAFHAIRYTLPAPRCFISRTDWDPACGITDVMRWLTHTGWQFGYDLIQTETDGSIPKNVQHLFTYTNCISLPTETARAFPFREDTKLYGWEDTEWGMRLRDAGAALHFDDVLTALHHHHIECADSLKRMEEVGASARIMGTLVPGFDRVPHGWKLLAYQLIALLPTMRGIHTRAFLKGMRKNP
jgi:glycosyltransferase involved in cell wall biosynthesis